MQQQLDIKDAATQLCDELNLLGLKLPYTSSLDIMARMAGHANWRGYALHKAGSGATHSLSLVYLSGFAEKGYWWTKAEADPWLLGAQGEDFDGPYATVELASERAQRTHPRAALLPYTPSEITPEPSSTWGQVSVFARFKLSVPLTATISKIMQQPGCDERREMNENFQFQPKYARANGRLTSVTARSALTCGGVDTIRRMANFNFDARLEISKPVGFDLKSILDEVQWNGVFSDTLDAPEVTLTSWQ